MSRPTTARTVGLVVALVGLAGLVALAWWRVPWHPVPGGAVIPVPVSAAFTPAEVARADAFAPTARLLSRASLLVSLLVSSVLGFTPLRHRLTRRLRGWWWVRVATAAALLLLAEWLVTLPLGLLLRRRLLRFDLTRQPLGGWLRDQLVTLAVTWVATALVLVLLLGLARRLTRSWPAVAGVLLAGFVLAASFAYPVLVEPLFNRFTPLPDGTLRTQILRVAQEEGVHVDDVLVADASRRTTTLNAYVSGYGDTRRVVLYDTTLDALPDREIVSVVAHELGHARYDDVLTGSLLGAAGALAGVGLLALVLPTAGQGQGRDRRAAAAAVPLVLGLTAWAMVLVLPVQNTVSRQIETRADVGRARDHPRPGRLRRPAAPAGPARHRRPHARGVVAVLVRQSPDRPAAHRHRPAPGLTRLHHPAGGPAGGARGAGVSGRARRPRRGTRASRRCA